MTADLFARARALGLRIDQDSRGGHDPFYVLMDRQGRPIAIGCLETIALNPVFTGEENGRKEDDHEVQADRQAVVPD